MGFMRRSRFDTNVCQFQGHIVDEIRMEQVKKQDKTWVDKTTLMIVCNSNPFNIKSKYFIPLFAYGYLANEIFVKFKKGCKVFVFAEYKGKTEQKGKKREEESPIVAQFEIKKIVLEQHPDYPDKKLALEQEEDIEE